jgi:hypothetical protein
MLKYILPILLPGAINQDYRFEKHLYRAEKGESKICLLNLV